jgi:Barstar (barnase inhibitor)
VGSASNEKPVFVIDGSRFTDFDGFAQEFSTLLTDWTWRGNLNAFEDILRGGFGTPEGGFVLRWLNSERSRDALGTQFDVVIRMIRDHGPGGRESEDGVELELL